ncbi:MAG: peptidoglycan-associated lipoprotein Pal [Nitrospinota bacterium]
MKLQSGKFGAVNLLMLAVFTVSFVFFGACASTQVEVEDDANVVSGGDDPNARPLEFPDKSTVLATIYFDFDSSTLSQESRDLLANHSNWLRENPFAQLQIEGHCDERGTEEYNLALGERRANTVKDYLASLGVGSERIFTISYGEELPAATGSDSAAWAKNRRAQFSVTFK